MAATQFISAKVGMVTGMGLAGVLRRHYAPAVLYPAGYTSVFADAFYREYEQISFDKASVKAAADAFFAQAKSALQK